MNTKWIVGIVIALIVLAGGYALSRQTVNNQTASQQESGVMNEQKDEAMAPKAVAGMMEEDKMIGDEKMMEKSPGAYKDYSSSALAEATKDGGKAELFFWAAWCPSC